MDDDLGRKGDKRPLGTRINISMTSYLWITIRRMPIMRIFLRGEFTAEKHQEVVIAVTHSYYIRISRNNSDDTFQVGANPTFGGVERMPVIGFWTPNAGITVDQVFSEFARLHAFWPFYPPDCQTFAQEICKKLSEEAKRTLASATDDDFM